MLSKFSVKRPLTIFVSVILVIMLGVISFMNMKTDLLPSIDLPYVVVFTTYPGASPEKIETTVTTPIESALSITSGVKNVMSTSSENTSMIIFEFGYSVNMDSVMIELNNNLNMVSAMLPKEVQTPMLMKINPNMMPVMVLSVDKEGADIKELSKLVEDEVVPELRKVEGVASVDGTGILEQRVVISLNQDKIDEVNDELLSSVSSDLADARSALLKGQNAIKDAKKEFDKQSQGSINDLNVQASTLEEAITQIEKAINQMQLVIVPADLTIKMTNEAIKVIEKQIEAQGGTPTKLQTESLKALNETLASTQAKLDELNATKAKLEGELQKAKDGSLQIENGKVQLSIALSTANSEFANQEKQIKDGLTELDDATNTALESANISALVTQETLSGILMAENFSMPAGYLIDGETKYAVKVGEGFSTVEELESLVIADMSDAGIGKIKLKDVADIAMGNNSSEMYSKVNGNDGILVSIQKQNTQSTAELSKLIREEIETLKESQDGLNNNVFMDQGVYIDIVIGSVIQNLLMGGVLAVIILLLFLKSFKPTLVVSFSIPISLMLAIVLMYFSNVNLNIISLAGLALGVGMLVDNSIVAIENIYRLRSLGYNGVKASIVGAKKIAGAITASTLTTICVFLPIVFTDGISKQLFVDMGLTIAYSLIASLVVALTLVPALCSGVLRNYEPKEQVGFEKFKVKYSELLEKVLDKKAILIIGVVALLVLSGFLATRMGTAFIPESDSSELMGTLSTDDELNSDDTRKIADEVSAKIMKIDGIKTVGAMQSGDNGASIYIVLEEERSRSSMEITSEINEATKEIEGEFSVSGASMGIDQLAGSGVQVKVKGDDLEVLKDISVELTDLLKGVEGVDEVTNGLEEGSTELMITVDKSKAMEYTLTVAQVYQAVADAIVNEKKSTEMTIDHTDTQIYLERTQDSMLTRDTLKNLKIKTKDGEVKLSKIAKIEEQQGLNSISHNNYVRTMSVNVAIKDTHNIGLVARDVDEALATYEAPSGYSVEVEGENETIMKTITDLILMVLMAIVMIYLIMVAQFQSLLSPFIIMFTIPLAFTGGLLGLFICGMEISVISMLGFLVLAGVVVNNGIVFIDYTNQLRSEGVERRTALLMAGADRIRPIMMTAATTILGLFTLALGMGSGSDMLQPLAIVVISGLIYSTILTLFVVPALYEVFQKKAPKVIDENQDEIDSIDENESILGSKPTSDENADELSDVDEENSKENNDDK